MLSDSTVAAVYDRRWLTTPALIETPLQVRTPRRPYHLLRFPSFALPHGACSGASMTAGRCIVLAKHIFQPRIARIFTNGKRLRRRLSSPVLFVFIPAIRGSRTSGQDGIWAAYDRGSVCEWFAPSGLEIWVMRDDDPGFPLGFAGEVLDDDAGEEGIGCSREEGTTVVQDDLGDACEDASGGLALKCAPSGANSGIRDSFFPQIVVFYE